jgi:flavin-dependent dehydrogenase
MDTLCPESRIAIAGAGMTGAYLYRLLARRGITAELFDPGNRTQCGLAPCAWGTSRGFREGVKESGLDPEDYILRRPGQVIMDDIKLTADLMTFDKPRLIKDLIQDAPIRPELLDIRRYDRIIDATGSRRAFLPPIKNDILLPCVQYRVKSETELKNRIKLGGVGYAWCFPLSGKEYHLGCGNLRKKPGDIMDSLNWLGKNAEILCRCSAEIRLTGPARATPFVANGSVEGIWGVGEAIGCVAPVAGDGIVTGMRTVRLLLQYWNDPEAYTSTILREFAWMEEERQVVDKLLGLETLGPQDAWVIKKNSGRMGMRIGIRDALILLRHLK